MFDIAVTFDFENETFGSESPSEGLIVLQNHFAKLLLTIFRIELAVKVSASKYTFGSETILQ